MRIQESPKELKFNIAKAGLVWIIFLLSCGNVKNAAVKIHNPLHPFDMIDCQKSSCLSRFGLSNSFMLAPGVQVWTDSFPDFSQSYGVIKGQVEGRTVTISRVELQSKVFTIRYMDSLGFRVSDVNEDSVYTFTNDIESVTSSLSWTENDDVIFNFVE